MNYVLRPQSENWNMALKGSSITFHNLLILMKFQTFMDFCVKQTINPKHFF